MNLPKKRRRDPLYQVFDELKYTILEFLPSIPDLWSLSCTCKQLREIYANENLSKNLLRRNLNIILKSFDLTMHDLGRVLKIQRGGSVVSGSCILQAYLGVNWNTSDLDIYIGFRDNQFLGIVDSIMRVVPNCDIVSIIPNPYAHLFLHKALIEIDRKNGRKLQFIFVDNRDQPKHVRFIVKTFDLSIVQNYFDGTKWRARYFKHILNRRMEFTQQITNNPLDIRNIMRIKKYMSRGFTFYKTEKPQYIDPMAWMYIDDVFESDAEKEGNA